MREADDGEGGNSSIWIAFSNLSLCRQSKMSKQVNALLDGRLIGLELDGSYLTTRTVVCNRIF